MATNLTSDIEVNDIKKITDTIKSHYGFDFENYAISSFQRRVKRFMDLQNVKSIDLIIEKLKSNPFYFKKFLSEITVNVTEMFRDPTFWIALKKEVLLPLFKNKQEIKIWHAGCSSGEEVYSMAILLDNIGKLNSSKIYATDIDEKILFKAENRIFSEKNIETNSSNFKEILPNINLLDYFDQHDNNFRVKTSLTQNILFRTHDLVTEAELSEVDIILCRNVLIYFNQNLQNRVIKKLTDGLASKGILCIGSKESLIWSDDIQKYEEVNKEGKIFRKI